DYGHETTSEAFSFWIWLETMYGRVTGDWTRLDNAWSTMERYIIPAAADQPTGGYNTQSPATYAAEHATPDLYPPALNSNGQAGRGLPDAVHRGWGRRARQRRRLAPHPRRCARQRRRLAPHPRRCAHQRPPRPRQLARAAR